MGCVFPDASLCSEGEIVGKAKAESLKTLHFETIQFYICIPVIIIGLVSNALVLWIWLSVKIQFYESVYLFRALAVADFLYVASYILTRLHIFDSAHVRLFFLATCYGNRYFSNYITLILAIARFIMLFFPLQVKMIMSHFRLSLSLMLITCFILPLTTYSFAFQFFNAQKSNFFYIYVVTKVIMTIMPALAQNILMLKVVLKLRWFSKTLASSCDVKVLQLPQQEQTISEQEKKIQSAQKLEISSLMQTRHLLALDHTETVCDAGPRNPWIPVDTEETAQSDQAAEGQLKTKQESVVFEEDLEIIQEGEPIPEAEPQNSREGYSICVPESGSCDDRSTLQSVSAPNKLQTDVERGLIYVVLAMCLCTFVSEVFCTVAKFLFPQNLYTSQTCNVINLISHSINLVFYLFISSFRQTLFYKTRELLDRYTSTSVKTKASHPTTVDSEGRSVNSKDSKLHVRSSSKFTYGREGMAASPVSW